MSGLSQGIFVACTPTAVYVRVVGRGACRNSPPLHQFGLKKLQEGYRNVYVDLQDCDAMDSTFLGVFAGLGFALNGVGRLTLLDLRNDLRRALIDLGLDQIPSVQTFPPDLLRDQFPPEECFQLLPGSTLSTKERPLDVLDEALMMLEAHECLCRLDTRNEAKFREVKQFLREDIARHIDPPAA